MRLTHEICCAFTQTALLFPVCADIPFIFIPVFHAVAADDTLVVTAAPQDREGSYSGDNVYSTLKTLTPRNETPQSISIVTPQLIRDFNVTSVDDAVKFVSGVTQGNTLGGIEDGFVKRGFGSNTDGSVFIDGVRSNRGWRWMPLLNVLMF